MLEAKNDKEEIVLFALVEIGKWEFIKLTCYNSPSLDSYGYVIATCMKHHIFFFSRKLDGWICFCLVRKNCAFVCPKNMY